jgi:hypothetical protein
VGKDYSDLLFPRAPDLGAMSFQSFINGTASLSMMSLFNTIPRTKRSHGHKRIQHPNVKEASKPVADVNSIDSFDSKRNMEEFPLLS